MLLVWIFWYDTDWSIHISNTICNGKGMTISQMHSNKTQLAL